jgi:hypothetical protein
MIPYQPTALPPIEHHIQREVLAKESLVPMASSQLLIKGDILKALAKR